MTILYRTADEHPDDIDLGRVGMASLGGTRRHYDRPPTGTNAVLTHSRRAAADTYLMLLAARPDVAEALFATAEAFKHLQEGTYIRLTAEANDRVRADVVNADSKSILAIARTEPGAVLFSTPETKSNGSKAEASSITLSSPDWMDQASIAGAVAEAAYKAVDGFPIIFAATADDQRLQIESLGFERDAKTLSKAHRHAAATARKSAVNKLAASSAAIHMWVDDEDDD